MATQKGRNWSSGDIVTAANLSSVERGVSAVSSSYEPTTWANGDTVTAAALNNIEQGIVNADGGGETWITLCEEEVTTEDRDGIYGALLSYSQLISADTIRVTFDGNEYICENVSPAAGGYVYGGFTQSGLDFSEYPFAIISEEVDNGSESQIATETSGTHTIKIEVLQDSDSSDFSTAEVTFISSYGSYGVCIAQLQNTSILLNVVNISNGSNIYNVPLYKGQYILSTACFGPNADISQLVVTGNITIVNGLITIQGNGTITCSGTLPV